MRAYARHLAVGLVGFQTHAWVECLHVKATSFKGEIRCKMDLEYDGMLECSFGSNIVHIDAFLNWLFLDDSTKTL